MGEYPPLCAEGFSNGNVIRGCLFLLITIYVTFKIFPKQQITNDTNLRLNSGFF